MGAVATTESTAALAADLRRERDPTSTTESLRAPVLLAHARQLERNRDANGCFVPNALVDGRLLEQTARGTDAAWSTLDALLRRHYQSPRGRTRLLRVARTIADLDQRDMIEDHDVLQAGALRVG